MNNDFRIKIGVLSHIKIRRLIGRHGIESYVGLQRLWEYAASTESSDGILLGLNSADVSLIAEINDEKFGDNLADLGLLDQVENGYAIHNWRRHNPWCSESKTRSDDARKAATARWEKTRSSGSK